MEIFVLPPRYGDIPGVVLIREHKADGVAVLLQRLIDAANARLKFLLRGCVLAVYRGSFGKNC